MKIKMLTSIAGSGFAFAPGDITERFDDAEVKNLIEAGYAVPVAEQKVERAVKAPATEKRGK